MAKPVKLNSVADLKLAADEFLPTAFSTLGYQQSFGLVDLKLGLGLSTVAICGLLYYMEKHMSFVDSYYYIAALVGVYAVLSAALYYFSFFPKFKDNKYIGVNDRKEKISVFTHTTKFDPIYNIKLVVNDNFDAAVEEQIPFTKMFDSFGYISQDEFKQLMKQLLEKKTQ